MNAATKAEAEALQPAGLALLRAPVPQHLISPLPKGTKAQNECPAEQKINCRICGGWHHPKIIHLDYVGHAAATHLLLDADPHWSWEPVAFDKDTGLPKFDASGGLWIKLTVCGVTRIGYGHANNKASDAGAREKEVIGDAIRNAAMRFGLALDLWSKADLHPDDPHPPGVDPVESDSAWQPVIAAGRAEAMNGTAALNAWWGKLTEPQRKQLTNEFKGMRDAARAADGSKGGAK